MNDEQKKAIRKLVYYYGSLSKMFDHMKVVEGELKIASMKGDITKSECKNRIFNIKTFKKRVQLLAHSPQWGVLCPELK